MYYIKTYLFLTNIMDADNSKALSILPRMCVRQRHQSAIAFQCHVGFVCKSCPGQKYADF